MRVPGSHYSIVNEYCLNRDWMRIRRRLMMRVSGWCRCVVGAVVLTMGIIPVLEALWGAVDTCIVVIMKLKLLVCCAVVA